MTRIQQVAALLGYGEPQILEVFKNTLPTKLYWILFPIEDLRQAVDTTKRILTKEKLDKQLMGQTSTSPFMSVRDGTERRVSFNTRDELGDKIDTLTVVMSRLASKDSHERRPFKPQIYKAEVRTGLMVREVIRTGQIVEIGDNLQIIDPDRITEVAILEETLEDMVDRIIEETIGMKDIMSTIETGIGQERGHLQEITVVTEIEVQVIVDQDQGLELNKNRDRIRCYKCREYDHFVRDCPNSREERDLELLQQLLNMEEQTHRIESSDDDYRSPLNL